MALKLEGMSRKELEKLAGDVEKQLEKLKEMDLKAARDAAEQAAKKHGFSLTDIVGGSGRGRKKGGPKTVGKPKYRNPADPSKTWTGKGRQPNWYREGIAKGKKEKDFLIK